MKKQSTNTSFPSAYLVPLDGAHALFESGSDRFLVLNDAAADLWRELRVGGAPRTPEGAEFARELVRLGFLPATPAMVAGESGGCAEAPRILAVAPLQVAAGTSDPNPFSADPSW